MPLFHFDVREGVHFTPDEVGLECPDIAAAEREAAEAAASIGRDLLPKGTPTIRHSGGSEPPRAACYHGNGHAGP